MTPVDSSPPLGRRTLTRGAAWTLPAIALAAAAPAVASSTCPNCFTYSGGSFASGSGTTSGTTSTGWAVNLGTISVVPNCLPTGYSNLTFSIGQATITWKKRSDNSLTTTTFTVNTTISGGTFTASGTSTIPLPGTGWCGSVKVMLWGLTTPYDPTSISVPLTYTYTNAGGATVTCTGLTMKANICSLTGSMACTTNTTGNGITASLCSNTIS